MRLGRLITLAWRDLLAARSRAFVSGVGIALGVAVLVVIMGLGLGVRAVVLREVVRALPQDTIEVVPRTFSLGPFAVQSGTLFGATPLDADTLGRLSTLPGAAAAYPKLEVNLPLGAAGGARLFGRRLYSDVFMTGLAEELVAPEVGAAFRDSPDVIPVVLSDQLVGLYNASVAPALGTPKLSPQALTGFEFELQIGRSLMLGGRGARKSGTERARIVGVSRYAIRLGVSVPLETARRLLRDYGPEDGREERYASVFLRAKSPSDLAAVTHAVRAAGLDVDETAERTADLLTAAALLASTVGLLVLTLAALNIAHSFFSLLTERRRELAVLRAVGARQRDIVLLVLVESAMMGLGGGIVGVGAAGLASVVIDRAATVYLGDFPFKPDSFFVLPWWLLALALLAAVAAAALGALWPAVRAARASVAETLSAA